MSYSTKDTNKIGNPGDVLVEEILLVASNGFQQNITKMYSGLTIYEDIFANGLSGNIILSDSMNLVKNFPIIGEETLYITIRTPGVDTMSRRLRFKVYSVSTFVQGEGTATVAVRLEFMSPFVMASSRFLLNRSYANMLHSDIAKSIFNDVVESMKAMENPDILPKLSTHPTLGRTSLIIPNWHPIYAINWLTYRSVPYYNSAAADYMFYENLDGFNFVPLDTLKKRNPHCTYKYIPGGMRDNKGERMMETELRVITKYAVINMGDKLKESLHGMFGSLMLINEMPTKSYYSTAFSYRTGFKDTNKMNPNRLLPYDSKTQEMFSSYTKYHIKNHFSFDSIDDASFVDSSLHRQSLMQQMDSFTMTIDVFGDTTLRVGSMVNLEFIAPEYTKNKDDFLDPFLSGNYMVTAIRHDIFDTQHTMAVTVSRDSYKEPLADHKDKEIKII